MRCLRKRIAMRGRKMEKDIPLSYLKGLQRLYDEWIERYSFSEVVTIDTEKMDYLSDLVHRIDVMKKIEKHL